MKTKNTTMKTFLKKEPLSGYIYNNQDFAS